MTYRKLAIRILFYSLGLAALTGILAMVLPNSGHILWRLIGTAICTALASAFLLIAIHRLETPSTRAFGASLGVTVGIVYFSGTFAIWAGLIRSLVPNLEEKLGLTALLTAGCGALISLGLLSISIKKLQIAGYALTLIWGICLLLWLGAIWFLSQSEVDIIKHLAFPMQTLFPIIVLCCIRRQYSYMVTALTCAVTCCILVQLILIKESGSLSNSPKLLIASLVLGGVAAMFSIVNIIQFRISKYAIPWAEWSAVCISAITIYLLCMSIFYNIYTLPLPDIAVRLAIGSSILCSTAIIAIIIGQCLRASTFVSYDGTELHAFCPRCNAELDIPNGKSHCHHCGLRMKVHIELPHCRTCGYDITKNRKSSSCPECGDSVRYTTFN